MIQCTLCQRFFQAPKVYFEQINNFYYCDACARIFHTLQHRHSLSVDVSSLAEFNRVTLQLAQVDQPANEMYSSQHFCFSRSSTDGESYWLCYYYDRVSINLLKVLALFKMRYTLHDTLTHKDSLRFWPDYVAPQGVLAQLLQKGQENDKIEFEKVGAYMYESYTLPNVAIS